MGELKQAYKNYMRTGSKKDFNKIIALNKIYNISEDDFLKAAGYNISSSDKNSFIITNKNNNLKLNKNNIFLYE